MPDPAFNAKLEPVSYTHLDVYKRQVFKLRGKGIQNLNGRGRGDQLVRILVQVPTELNARQRELLQEFEAASGGRPVGGADPQEDRSESHKSFFDKLKDNINKEKDK